MTSAPDRRTLLLSLAGLAGLSGCGALGSIGGGPVLDAYELRPPATVPVARRSLARDVVVELPEAGAALDTDRIMIRPNPLQTQYLPGARWTGSAPAMLQTLILRTLQDANAFRYVGRRPLGSGADFALVSELTDFQAEVVPGTPGPRIRIRLIARLVREADVAVLASQSFQTTAEAASVAAFDIVTAFNAATDALTQELAQWVLGRLGAPVA
jgi:cholesterol transport system auxiliary component